MTDFRLVKFAIIALQTDQAVLPASHSKFSKRRFQHAAAHRLMPGAL